MVDQTDGLIGGPICHGVVPPALLDQEDSFLGQRDIDALWEIFVEIGRCWGNLPDDSVSVKSSWREFIACKVSDPPSYVGEYKNAFAVVQELIALYGRAEAFRRLFLDNGIPEGPPVTRLAHAKQFVIDEFIQVQVVSGGFRGFVQPASLNYNGYVGGSRYNLTPRVRSYQPEKGKTGA